MTTKQFFVMLDADLLGAPMLEFSAETPEYIQYEYASLADINTAVFEIAGALKRLTLNLGPDFEGYSLEVTEDFKEIFEGELAEAIDALHETIGAGLAAARK